MNLPTELADLADGHEYRTVWLTLAEKHYQSTDREEQLAASGVALRMMAGGTAGQQLGAWHELVEAVEMWHRWDLVADSQGWHDYLSIPSREKVCDDVASALDDIHRLTEAVA